MMLPFGPAKWTILAAPCRLRARSGKAEPSRAARMELSISILLCKRVIKLASASSTANIRTFVETCRC